MSHFISFLFALCFCKKRPFYLSIVTKTFLRCISFFFCSFSSLSIFWSIANLRIVLVKNCVFVFDRFVFESSTLLCGNSRPQSWTLIHFSKFIRYCWFDDSCSVFSEGFAGLYHTKLTQDCCTIKSDNKLTKDVVIWFSFHFLFLRSKFSCRCFQLFDVQVACQL